jgi:hypothetical protein
MERPGRGRESEELQSSRGRKTSAPDSRYALKTLTQQG